MAPTGCRGHSRLALLPGEVAPASAGVSGIEHVGVDQAKPVLLPIRLRMAARAVGPKGWARRCGGVVVVPGEDTDRVRMCRTRGWLAVAGDLTGEGGTCARARKGQRTK